ncbi:MAG: DUF6125 family protein [Archaeoglobaceae archaeon]
MGRLTDRQIADYFHRSYTAVDGLWFMKLEEEYGFDKALEVDRRVWEVLPKIQARKLKSILNTGDGLEALKQCLAIKLDLEGFNFETQEYEGGFRIIVHKCPWHELMVRSGREELSGRVGNVICNTEYPVWASEFENIKFELREQICEGSSLCTLDFRLGQE